MTDLKRKIAVAAEELYLTEGLAGFSMRKVAERIGVTAPSIYRHFENKEELLGEVVISGLKILDRYLRPALEADSAIDRLRRLIERYLDFAIEQPKYFDSAFLIPTPASGRLPEELAKHNWATFQMSVAQVSECMERGIFRPDDAMAVTITIWAEAHGLVTLYRMGRFGENEALFRHTYAEAVERVLKGLGVP